jgi:hypothetical protein
VNLSRAGSTPVTHPKFSGRREAWIFPPASEAGKRWFESSRPDQSRARCSSSKGVLAAHPLNPPRLRASRSRFAARLFVVPAGRNQLGRRTRERRDSLATRAGGLGARRQRPQLSDDPTTDSWSNGSAAGSEPADRGSTPRLSANFIASVTQRPRDRLFRGTRWVRLPPLAPDPRFVQRQATWPITGRRRFDSSTVDHHPLLLMRYR